jgi:hypothetical protein
MAQPERKVQIAIIKWLHLVMPHAMIQHCVNEHGKRGKAGMIAAQMSVSAGMTPGFPDLIIMPYAKVGVFFLEVKAPKGRVSTTQEHVHGMMRNLGYPVCVVRSIDDVRDFLQSENIGFNEVMM